MPDAPDTTVNMVTPQGQPVEVPAGELELYQRRGYRPESVEESVARVGADTRAAQTNPVEAFGQAAASTATFGASDVLQRAIGGEDARIYLQQLAEGHPTATTAGSVAGAFVPGGAGSIAGRLGKAVSGLGEGAGFLGRVGMGAAGGAAEGAAFGAAQAVHELALTDEPLSLEHIGSSLSSNMLYGGAFGGALGGAGKAAEVGLGKAKDALDEWLDRRALSKAAAESPEALASADVSTLDAPSLRKAEASEVERIEAERAPQRQQLVDDISEFRDRLRDRRVFETTQGAADRNVREAGASLRKADFSLRGALDNRAALVENPQKLLPFLQRQEQAMSEILQWGTEEAGKLAHANSGVMDTRIAIRNGEIPGYVPSALTEEGIQNAAELEMRRSGRPLPSSFHDGRKLDAIEATFPGAVKANLDLQRRIVELAAEPASERLTQIGAAREALGVPKPKSLGASALHAAAHFAGPLGALAEHGAGALGSLKKVGIAAAERGGRAASSFLGKAAAVAAKAPLATKVLAAMRYSDEPAEPKGETLPELYKARTDEVKQQVQIAANGTFQMRPEARQKMAARLAGIGALDPVGADRLETAGALRIAWLASQIPRRPDMAGIQVGPDTWHPSDMEMRSWARKAAAADDPHGALERVVSGHVTPEDASTMRALYPEMMQHFINTVSTELPTLQKTLPYERRLSLSLFSGIPVDPALDPRVFSFLQGQFAAEPGTAGGTQAPQAQPQFGSLKKSIDAPTPAQTRAQGAHV